MPIAASMSRPLHPPLEADQADEAYKLFDTQTTGKGVF